MPWKATKSTSTSQTTSSFFRQQQRRVKQANILLVAENGAFALVQIPVFSYEEYIPFYLANASFIPESFYPLF